MLTATEAKLIAYRKKSYFTIVEQKIRLAANNGETECAINMDEIPDGSYMILCEISNLLIELGYQTVMGENVINVYWQVQKPIFYDILGDIDDEEW